VKLLAALKWYALCLKKMGIKLKTYNGASGLKNWERFLKSAATVLVGGLLGALIGIVTGFPVDIITLMGIGMGVVVNLLTRYRFYQKVYQGEKQSSSFHGDASQTHAYRIFLATIFQVMGYLVQVKGRSEADNIQAANVIMGHLRLTKTQQQQAMRLFREGNQPDFAVDPVLAQFYSACQSRAHLIRQFIEIQMSVFYANGFPSPHERAMLLHICNQLGFVRRFEEMETYIKRRFHTASAGTYRGHDHRRRQRKPISMVHLQHAYGILGLNRHATNTEVKKAYRRLINRHHPDKLEAQNTSSDIMQKATEKTRAVKEAYELIKLYRRM
jgi:DnaJ like chaperone protein